MNIPKWMIVAFCAAAAMGVVFGLIGGTPGWASWATAAVLTVACQMTDRIARRETRRAVVNEIRVELTGSTVGFHEAIRKAAASTPGLPR